MWHQCYILLCSKMTSFLPSEGISEITFGSIQSRPPWLMHRYLDKICSRSLWLMPMSVKQTLSPQFHQNKEKAIYRTKPGLPISSAIHFVQIFLFNFICESEKGIYSAISFAHQSDLLNGMPLINTIQDFLYEFGFNHISFLIIFL